METLSKASTAVDPPNKYNGAWLASEGLQLFHTTVIVWIEFQKLPKMRFRIALFLELRFQTISIVIQDQPNQAANYIVSQWYFHIEYV